MKTRNLLKDPCWESKDLGEALPSSLHAVSVALPQWDDVIAYEEKEPKCINALKAVYPRFGFNPLVAEIASKALAVHGQDGDSSWPYPNIDSAKQAKLHCQRINRNCSSRITDVLGIKCLIVDKESSSSAKAFWQHTGLGLSSREAAIALRKESSPIKGKGQTAKTILLNRLSNIYGCPSNLVHLYPSGMAALTTALHAIRKIRGSLPVIQLGFPYVDVLKLPQIIFDGSELLLNTSLTFIKTQIEKKKPAALIIELPSNPMLQCVDLVEISQLARKYNIPIIADDTIGSPLNINVIPYADLIFSSLTKSFAGRGDILAGGLIISPMSPWKDELSKIIPSVSFSTLSDADSIELEETSRDVSERLQKLNYASLILKNKLETHPDIIRVLHPSDCKNFKNLLRAGGGYGCLLSFELRGGIPQAKRVYNALKVCKGPSLGTNFTLVCPYVLLAHYSELKWAEDCGVPSHLLRVSVGLEEPDELWKRFKNALNNNY